VKLISDFAVDLAWIDVMSPAESVAGIEQVAAVGDVDRICRNGQLLPECLADGQVESRMRRQVRCREVRLLSTGLRSEDIEGTPKMKVTSQIKGLGRQDEALEQLVVRLSLEAGVSSVSWAAHTQVLE